MNCHRPTAETRDTANGDSPDSIIAMYASSWGMPRSRSFVSIISEKRPRRSRSSSNSSRRVVWNASIQRSTRAFTWSGMPAGASSATDTGCVVDARCTGSWPSHRSGIAKSGATASVLSQPRPSASSFRPCWDSAESDLSTRARGPRRSAADIVHLLLHRPTTPYVPGGAQVAFLTLGGAWDVQSTWIVETPRGPDTRLILPRARTSEAVQRATLSGRPRRRSERACARTSPHRR